MKSSLLAVLFAFLSSLVQPSTACSTFFLHKDGHMLFGRNYDWVTGIGMVHTNLKGLSKTSLPMDAAGTISWESKYGSVTFNQFGKEFPNGGMNEKGLVIELMWLSESAFPSPDRRPALNVLQWIQYQLDNAATIDEVIASDARIRIVADGTPQHYLVADARGAVASIEFLDGKMTVHTGKDLPFPVLTNSPYGQSIQSLDQAGHGAKKAAGFADNSLQRFAKACSMVQAFQERPVADDPADYAFDILQNVSQGDFTKWSIVYDIENRKLYFKTQEHPVIKYFAMSDFDFSCTSKPLSYDMNQETRGDVKGRFGPFSSTENAKWLQEAIDKSSGEFSVRRESVDAAIHFPASVKCR